MPSHSAFRRKNALTPLVWTAVPVVRVVRSRYALTLYVQKAKCPHTPRPEGRCRGTRRPEYKCLDTLHPEGKMS